MRDLALAKTENHNNNGQMYFAPFSAHAEQQLAIVCHWFFSVVFLRVDSLAYCLFITCLHRTHSQRRAVHGNTRKHHVGVGDFSFPTPSIQVYCMCAHFEHIVGRWRYVRPRNEIKTRAREKKTTQQKSWFSFGPTCKDGREQKRLQSIKFMLCHLAYACVRLRFDIRLQWYALANTRIRLCLCATAHWPAPSRTLVSKSVVHRHPCFVPVRFRRRCCHRRTKSAWVSANAKNNPMARTARETCTSLRHRFRYKCSRHCEFYSSIGIKEP